MKLHIILDQERYIINYLQNKITKTVPKIMQAVQKSSLQKYYLLKKDIQLPIKLKLYFLIFQNTFIQIKSPRTHLEKYSFSTSLLSAFLNLSLHQKGMYLLSNINFVITHLDRQEKQNNKYDIIAVNDQIKNIQTTCNMLSTTLSISHWIAVSIKIDKINKSILITNQKKKIIIDIKSYFVRKSHKYKNALVLQTINDQTNKQAKKYTFSFPHQVFNKIYEELLKCVFSCQHQKILTMILEQDKSNPNNNKSSQKTLVFLNLSNINNYLAYKQKISQQIIQNKYQFKSIYNLQKLIIQQSYKNQKIFKIQNVFNVVAKQLKQKFLYALNYNNKFIVYSEILEEFSKKYKAFYQKIQFNGKIYDYIEIRQQSITNQQQVLFIKGIQNITGRNYIQFLQARIRTISPNQSKLIIHISIVLSAIITKQVVKNFLLQLNDMIFRKQPNLRKLQSSDENELSCLSSARQKNDEQLNITKSGVEEDHVIDFQQDDGQMQFQSSQISNRNHQDISGNGNQQISVNGNHNHNNNNNNNNNNNQNQYLFVKHHQQPISSQQYHKLMEKHYLFQQWIRAKNGGVICINQQIIGVQKKMFKQTVIKMGRQILKGQILKISLPAYIFRKQSHLQSIARDFSYAPLFFDRFIKNWNEIEAVKYASLLAISVGTLGISMQKPFNPILGQTMQLRIDGCPIFLQQISHQPPIASYYLQGRGYRIWGQIEPKVAFGLNNVKGYSNRPNYIQFQNGTILEMIFGKMVINGMMIGDRTFNFQDKIYVYDKKNNIFSQIIYGNRKKMISKNTQPCDKIHGTIYKIKQQFVNKFNKLFPRPYPTKQFIISQICTFQGIWNGEIKFGNQSYIHFGNCLPYQIIPDQYPLLSNSSYRTDLIQLRQNNIHEAQKQKQRLQQIQRRDRKLRQKYNNNK